MGKDHLVPDAIVRARLFAKFSRWEPAKHSPMGTLLGIGHPLFLPAIPVNATPPATLEGTGTGEPLGARWAEEAVRRSGVPCRKGPGAL
jgi:hypothetical protein